MVFLLSSYEIPEGEDRNAFSYASMKNVDYSKLKNPKSSRRHYTGKRMESGKGGSTSRFSPVMIFKLWERFSDSCLEVSESMEVKWKADFGYDEPIIYKQCIRLVSALGKRNHKK